MGNSYNNNNDNVHDNKTCKIPDFSRLNNNSNSNNDNDYGNNNKTCNILDRTISRSDIICSQVIVLIL